MLYPTEDHLSGLTWLFPPTKGNITQFTLTKQPLPQGEYPSMEEMTHFVLIPLLKNWTDYLCGRPTWSILQRPYLQGANVYANPERETPQRVFITPWEALPSSAFLPGHEGRDLCVKRRMQRRCIIIFSWEASRWKKKIKFYVSFCIHVFFSFQFLRKKKLFMSPVPPFSLSLSFLLFSPSVPKIRM